MASFTLRPELRGTFGMVASTHWLASAAGMAMLEKGGTAFDAAAAAGFVLQVVEPHQNGPGGDLPVVFWSARERRVRVVCGQGPAPAAATIERYRALGFDLVPGAGLLAAVVPGAVDGWLLLLRDYGTLPLRTVLEPAISYAEHGYPLASGVADVIARSAPLFREAWPSSAALYLAGRMPEAGDLFRNPALAATYARLLKEGEAAGAGRETQIEGARRAFYKGFVAEAIDRFCRTTEWLDSSGRAHGGLLTGDDLARWQASFEEPATYDYRGYTVAKTGSWGQGPAFLQMLALLKDFDLDDLDPCGAEFVHLAVECSKLALADRDAWYGDPDHVDVPLDRLLSDDYNAGRRALIGQGASLELLPGTIDGRPPRFPARYGARVTPRAREAGGLAAAIGEPNARRDTLRGDTVNVNAVDRWGNMVSAMPSGGWLQSSPAIPELGFCLGSRAQMFWLEEGLPASLAPGRRPRTTLTPGLALKEGVPYLAFGSPGGDGQDQWALAMFLRHIHGGLNLQEAIEAPAWMSHHAPSSFYPRDAEPGLLEIEGRFSETTLDALRRRGHRLSLAPDWSLGRLAAVGRTADGQLLAAANPRNMQGYAVGR